ncbi:hypothetical protein ACP275_07G075000 [Erythranthe tilingii]
MDIDHQKPSWRMVLGRNDFSMEGIIPFQFAARNRSIWEKTAKLTVKDGKFWIVDVHLNCCKCCFYGLGWQDMLVHFKMLINESLEFTYVGQSTFEVTAYRFGGSVKKISYAIEVIDVETDSGDDEFTHSDDESLPDDDDEVTRSDNEAHSDNGTDETNSNLKFKAVLQRYARYKMDIPYRVAFAAAFYDNQTIMMEFEGKSIVEAVIRKRKNNKSWRFALQHNWSLFRGKSKLVFGLAYSFEYIPNKNVMAVTLVE